MDAKYNPPNIIKRLMKDVRDFWLVTESKMNQVWPKIDIDNKKNYLQHVYQQVYNYVKIMKI